MGLIEMIFIFAVIACSSSAIVDIENEIEINESVCVAGSIEKPIVEMSIDVMPISNYIRPYNMTKTGVIWRAIDGQSYIDPDHEVVQWYARNTILNESGLYYLNGKMVLPIYYPDFAYENGDHWMNADYYLSHNLTGDCDDFAIGMASILEAKGIPNMFVALTDSRNDFHHYVQYYYNGEYYTADFTHPRYQLREDNPRDSLKKVWMFNIDNDYSTYVENWVEL